MRKVDNRERKCGKEVGSRGLMIKVVATTLLPVACITATDCNSAARANLSSYKSGMSHLQHLSCKILQEHNYNIKYYI